MASIVFLRVSSTQTYWNLFLVVGSECLDERFVSFNNHCYLFVYYPEVDFLTAQNACRGINNQLASIASKEEENFVVTSIRNSLDFSPQGLYWVGGELVSNGEFEWTDGAAMNLSVSCCIIVFPEF